MTYVFAAFGLASQGILLGFFAARRWRPALAAGAGWIAYGFGAVGLLVGAWLLVSGASWRLYSGPLLYAVWSAFGLWADMARHVQWRAPRIVWSLFAPYLTLYLAAQMFLWWPLWNYWRIGWFFYFVLFAGNTALNISGHFVPPSKSSPADDTGAHTVGPLARSSAGSGRR